MLILTRLEVAGAWWWRGGMELGAPSIKEEID
jgi:hypothetical protein